MLNPDSKSWRNYILKIKWRQLSCSILPKFYPEPYTCKNIVWTHIGIFYILSSFKHLCLSGYTLLIRLYWSFTYTATDQSPSSMVIVWHLIPLKRKKERVSCNLAQSKKGGKREGKGKNERTLNRRITWRTYISTYTCTCPKFTDDIVDWRHNVWTCKINGIDMHSSLPWTPHIPVRGRRSSIKSLVRIKHLERSSGLSNEEVRPILEKS